MGRPLPGVCQRVAVDPEPARRCFVIIEVGGVLDGLSEWACGTAPKSASFPAMMLSKNPPKNVWTARMSSDAATPTWRCMPGGLKSSAAQEAATSTRTSNPEMPNTPAASNRCSSFDAQYGQHKRRAGFAIAALDAH